MIDIMYIVISMLIGGLIGWGTNLLAVRLIFRPYEPKKILGFRFQGLIPKRRGELAFAIGQTVEKELLTSEEIVSHLTNSGLKEKVTSEVVANIKLKAQGLLPSFLPQTIKDHFSGLIDGVIQDEVTRFFSETVPKLSEEMKNSLPIAKMVEDKLNQLDIKDLEQLVLSIAHKELKHIEYLGGILGLTIGLVQGLFFIILT